MERISEAIKKAERSRRNPGTCKNGGIDIRPEPAQIKRKTFEITRAFPNADHLEENRIISSSKMHRDHIVFDILRTKIFRAMQENGWKSLAITSPTPGCGKTMVAINLAISMSRQTDCRTALIDLDLRRPSLERILGVKAPKSLRRYLDGDAELNECLVLVEENLIVGLNDTSVRNSSEMMQHQKTRDILNQLTSFFDPSIVIFDLPPMLSSDDALAFLPQVDCCLLIIEAGRTTPKQIEECEMQFRDGTEFLGVVLNKCRDGDHSLEHYDESSGA